MYENRIAHLEEAHQVLNKQIDNLEKTGSFSDERINYLKKQRLQYKDEIARLKKLQWEHDREALDWEDDR